MSKLRSPLLGWFFAPPPRRSRVYPERDLAAEKRQRAELEYVVVHELVHLLEPSHNARFKALMSQFLPDWKARKSLLAMPQIG